MPNTHCLPTGALATNEMPVPKVSGGANILTPAGAKRGVVVMCHGIQLNPPSIPGPIANDMSFFWGTLATDLQSDGWIVLYAITVGDTFGLTQGQGVYNDVSTDTGNGSRHQTTLLHWWDHVVIWVKSTYGNWPIVAFGGSWGGMAALQVAVNRTSTIIAYVAHHPVSVLSKLNATTLAGNSFFNLPSGSAGLDIGATGLNGVPIPGLLGWGTTDTVVDHPNSGDLLTPAIQSAASGAGQPVTGNSQAEGHIMQGTDITVITGWFTSTVDPLAPAVH